MTGKLTLTFFSHWNTVVVSTILLWGSVCPHETYRTDYQPVSYILTSKRGTQSEFASMVSTCAAAGVGVIVDAVTNHMSR